VFSLTARTPTESEESIKEQQTEDNTTTGEFCVLSLPKPTHIVVILNWQLHRKELNHFIVNTRVY
jgi:hypothetical protein